MTRPNMSRPAGYHFASRSCTAAGIGVFAVRAIDKDKSALAPIRRGFLVAGVDRAAVEVVGDAAQQQSQTRVGSGAKGGGRVRGFGFFQRALAVEPQIALDESPRTATVRVR